MKCPFCANEATQVVETRLADDDTSVRRRRQCGTCERRFTTYERAELSMPTVVKSDGRRVEFDQRKLRASIDLALRKRPVHTQCVDDAIARIELRLLNLGKREVETRILGEAVMDELQALDKVAYIRYGSVYRSVGDLDAFKHLIEQANNNPLDE